MAEDLASALRLIGPASPGTYSVVNAPGSSHLVGRDPAGQPCILLRSSDQALRAPVRLQGLTVQYAVHCDVAFAASATAERILTVVTGTNQGDDEEHYFLQVMATVLDLVGENPTVQQIAEAISQLAGIFQRLTGPTKESITGIVGELIVIASSSDTVGAVAAWRSDPTERYDFVHRDIRLEAKSTLTRRRAHSFSYEQCDVPDDCDGFVASILIERGAGGTSVADLVDEIARGLARSPAAMLRFHETLANTLGNGLPNALAFTFDLGLARAEMAYYDLRKIPAIRTPEDPSLSQIRFTSDLTASAPLAYDILVEAYPDMDVFIPIAS